MPAQHLVPILLAVLGATLPVATGRAETSKQYLVEAKLTTTLPDGQEKILCYPRLLVLEGTEGNIRLGNLFGPLEGVMTERMLISGTSAKLKVINKEGRLFLDATVSRSSGSSSDEDGAETTMTGVHIVKPITLGKRLTVPASFAGGRWEFLVEQEYRTTFHIAVDDRSGD